MLKQLTELPAHVFAVKATDKVTGDELKDILIPGLQRLVDKYGEIYSTRIRYKSQKLYYGCVASGLDSRDKTFQKMDAYCCGYRRSKCREVYKHV